MKRSVLGMTLAATLAVTSLSGAPVRAENQDYLGALIFGAVALAVLGKHIDNNRNQNTKATPPPKPTTQPTVSPPRRKVLPRHCMRRHNTDHGRVKLMGNRCLKNNYRHFAALPDRCFSRLRNLAGKTRKGFRPQCLKRRGYSIQ